MRARLEPQVRIELVCVGDQVTIIAEKVLYASVLLSRNNILCDLICDHRLSGPANWKGNLIWIGIYGLPRIRIKSKEN